MDIERPVNGLSFETFFKSHVQGPGYYMGIKFAFDTGRTNLVGHTGSCHAGLNTLNSWASDKKTRFYSQLRVGSDRDYDIACLYWDALLDPITSPWRIILKDVFIHVDSKGKRIAFSISVDQDTPTQVLANLAVASRLPSEHYDSLMLFKEIHAKVNRTLSVVLPSLAGKNNSSAYMFEFTRGHYALPVEAFDLKNLLNGTPVYDDSKILGDNSSYLPCNVIWRGTGKLKDYIVARASVTSVKKRVFEQAYQEFRKQMRMKEDQSLPTDFVEQINRNMKVT